MTGFEAVAIILLAIGSLTGILIRRLRMPYTVGMVLVGLSLSLLPQVNGEATPEIINELREFQLTPEIILGLLVPPLIYEAAFHLKFEELRRNLVTVLAFAIPGVILTTFLVGGLVAWGTEIPFAAALLFGTLVAATDPVAVIALFRSIGVPKRLQVLLEGESLLNDGTAIVLFTLAGDVVIQGSFELLTTIAEFVRVAGGGLLVGLALGYMISLVFRRIDDPMIETSLTLVLAYGPYLVAEQFHFSGVLAVVAAGLISGNLGPQRMSPTSRIQVFNFWQIAAFLANSFVFLLIGLEIELALLFQNWQAILVAILAVLVARAAVIYGLSWPGQGIPRNWRPVLYWGGLRGAISLALALSLPIGLGEDRAPLEAMAFGVVLFTLLVQGPTMGPLVRRMDLIRRSEEQERYDLRNARVVASRAAYERVAEMHREGVISDHIWSDVSPMMEEHTQALAESLGRMVQENPQVEAQELGTARQEALRAQRTALTELLTSGMIGEEVYSRLIGEVDAALDTPNTRWRKLVLPDQTGHAKVDSLLAAIIQERDAETAVRALRRRGFSTTRLPSAGGFLGRRNITLLVGFARGQEDVLVETLRKSSRQRAEFLVSPLESWRGPFGNPRRVIVGGATLFVFDVEDYREF